MSNRTAIVIGAGIAGLAAARALAVRGYKVKVIERTQRAIGASIRNFGMIIPFGQPDGKLYERAMQSRRIWKQVCDEAGIWYDETGSLQLAYSPDEWQVLQEVKAAYPQRGLQLLTPEEIVKKSTAVVPDDLRGGLHSKDEIIIDPRQAIRLIPSWLTEKYNVEFVWGKAVTDICYPAVYAGKEQFNADAIYVCSGADFETLYPELYAQLPITRCKLQMLRLEAQPGGWRMGPMLCAGLSLIHYNSFKVAGSLAKLKERFEAEYPEYLQWGIHVMVSQNQQGELTVGDSHEYALTPDPFDKSIINDLILAYLYKFARFKNTKVIETWNGIYPRLTNGETDVILEPENGVTIVNGLGGAGMTFSFDLFEKLVAEKN